MSLSTLIRSYWDIYHQSPLCHDYNCIYCIYSKYSERWVWANSVDQDETPILKLYTVCNSLSSFWTYHQVVKCTFFFKVLDKFNKNLWCWVFFWSGYMEGVPLPKHLLFPLFSTDLFLFTHVMYQGTGLLLVGISEGTQILKNLFISWFIKAWYWI